MTPEQVDVVVVGAGLSGLATAYRLLQSGMSVQVLEATSQVGGRIQSCRTDDNRYLGDLGPSWCWPEYQPVVSAWLDTLDIELQPQFIEGLAVIERDRLQPVAHHDLPSQHGISRLQGGPQSLVDGLLQKIGPQIMSLDHPVSAIELVADQLRVSTANNSHVITARQCVIAVPPRLIAQDIDFSPALDTDRIEMMQRAPTWMAAQAKVVIQYSTPFWREQGLSGRVASQVGPLVEVHDHSGVGGDPAALFGFVGVPAEARGSNSDALKAAIVDQLVHCFGDQAAAPVSIHLKDWALDSRACSRADLVGPAAHPSVLSGALRDATWDGRLHFAGAEFATISPGLIEGALHAADTAAEAVVKE